MTAGLAGFGISGVFYICLVLVMPVRELWMSIKGKSSVDRWKQVGFQWALAFLMTAAVYVEVLMIRAGLRWLAAGDGDFSFWLSTKFANHPLMPQMLWLTSISLMLIAAVFLGTYLAYLAQRVGLIQPMAGTDRVHS
jgi:hypothetical protein